MRVKGYLVVGKNGTLRACKSFIAPIGHDSVAIELNITIPDSAFKPAIKAEINIEEKDVSPLLIKTGKLNKISKIIKEEIGLDVKLRSIESLNKKKGTK